MDSQQKPPHQETIPELVARLVIAFENKQAEKQANTTTQKLPVIKKKAVRELRVNSVEPGFDFAQPSAIEN